MRWARVYSKDFSSLPSVPQNGPKHSRALGARSAQHWLEIGVLLADFSVHSSFGDAGARNSKLWLCMGWCSKWLETLERLEIARNFLLLSGLRTIAAHAGVECTCSGAKSEFSLQERSLGFQIPEFPVFGSRKSSCYFCSPELGNETHQYA